MDLIDFIRHHVVPVAIVVGVGIWAIYFAWSYRWSKRQPREPSDESATLRGTARVLSFKKTGAARLVDMGPQGVTNKKKAHYYCIMKLEVHIPGREPYVTLMRKTLRPEERVGSGRARSSRCALIPTVTQRTFEWTSARRSRKYCSLFGAGRSYSGSCPARVSSDPKETTGPIPEQ